MIESIRRGMTIAALFAAVLFTFTAPISAALVQQAKLTAGDAATGDKFGSRVALQGQTALIGASSADIGGKSDLGAAYIFTGSGSSWTQSQKLTAGDAAVGDQFGLACVMDGDFAFISAPYKDNSVVDDGSAYVFQNVAGTWTQTQVFTQPGTTSLYFGRYMALTGDRAAVAAYDGPVCVYEYDGSTWGLMQTLTPATTGTAYGVAVDVEGDRLVVAAKYDNQVATRAGAAYVYEYDGSTWAQVAKLTANDGLAKDYLGTSASLEGDMLALGAPGLDVGGGDWAGAVYLFQNDGAGNWSQVAKIIGSDTDATDYFGNSVLLKEDALYVGAHQKENGGTLYTYRQIGGVWTEVEKTISSDLESGDLFGGSFDRDGDTVLLGATGDDDAGSGSGSAYVFVDPNYSAPFPGDANYDKVVNAADAAILAQCWLKTSANWGMGDFNDDKVVDDKDATLLAVNWLKSPGVSSTAAIPEPAAAVYVLVLCLSLAVFRRKNHGAIS